MTDTSTRPDRTDATAPPPSTGPRRPTGSWWSRQDLTRGFWVKTVLVALVDALGVYGILAAGALGQWGIVAFLVVALVAVNVVYFSKKMLPAKYLVPGLVFLLVYQVFVVLYTGFTAFTNYGDGHNSTQADAVEAILVQNEARLPDSPTYPLTVVVNGDELGFAVVDGEGDAELGTAEQPLEPVDATLENGRVASVDGWETLQFTQVLERQDEIFALRVPISDDPNDGSVRTPDGSTGYVYVSTMEWDEAAGTITNTATGDVYTADEEQGAFVAADGSQLGTGWKVFVGFENFSRVFTDSKLAGPFVGVLLWTFAFAILSVVLTFGLGLFMAVVLNHPKVRGRKIYRSLLIVPYAFPAFLTALVWQGMLNRDFGFVNATLLGGASIPWLTDPWLAKISVLVVNLWLGFPYMFLICTGALQSIPNEIYEAGKIDGAKPLRLFRSLTMPLLLVSTAPLLISSFAFNFNNFNVVYLLTEGGPDDLSAPVDVGATDILITFVYRLAFGGVNRQYGLACAVSILIFLIVASISAATFSKTRALEDLH
ncbi:sugar ABC transporter permease [Cellulomonas algicola]|uniref:Maltose/maltodextrin transport system permease protein n=1 Tax=Cellulomonas algicola TaxID=2071633 RepID=A0A401UZ96_9CELL|nr:ABC transporter permease subunit [Cellulomonas algicola]GCD19934.1 sugar ABC transporter permease [Cellulomonas algicola]